MDTQSFFLWSIWIALLLMNKLFFMFLVGKSFYSLVSGARMNVNELIDVAVFLFGFVFFLGLRLAFRTPDDSRISVGALVMQNFRPASLLPQMCSLFFLHFVARSG
jgi:hypothetical protein